MDLNTMSSPLTSLPWTSNSCVRLLTQCPHVDVLTGISNLTCLNWTVYSVSHTCSSGICSWTQDTSPPSSYLLRPNSWNRPWLILPLILIGQPVCQQVFLALSLKIFPDHCVLLHHCDLPPWSRPLSSCTWIIVIAHNWFHHFTHPVISPCHRQGGSGNYFFQPHWRDGWHIWEYSGQGSKDGLQDFCLVVSQSK